MHTRKSSGFTLIELLVVIAIIGILSTLAIVALGNARSKSRDAKRISDMRQVYSALELFYNDASMYPTMITPGKPINYDNTVYMAIMPSNPTPTDGGTLICPNTTLNYPYSPNSTGATNSSYSITYCLGAATGEIRAGTNVVTPLGLSN
jgi:prepilin-type N-terminal cleavage/methylation domain-containing protein